MARIRCRGLAFLATLAAVAGAAAVPSTARAATAGQGAGDLPPVALERLIRAAGPDTWVRARRGMHTAGFVRARGGGDLLPGSHASSARAKADEFLQVYGDLFGLDRPDEELEVIGEWRDRLGMSHVRYRQRFGGVEVFGAEVRAHVDDAGRLAVVAGATVSVQGPLSTTPAWPPAAADAIAIGGRNVEAVAHRLVVYHTGLLRGAAGTAHLAWEVEVADQDVTVHERVFVDAVSGTILDRISDIHEALHRRASESSLANVVWDEGDPEPMPLGWAGGTAAQVAAWNAEVAGAHETYNLFGSLTGGTYLSYDGADAIMRTVNNDPGISCPNANWNGVSTNYCDGVTGDDTVAHEWTHAYTEYTDGLLYAWQAGALNESYSDIFGEVVDFLNGRGTDAPLGPRAADGSACSTYGAGLPSTDATYRWLSGEDDSAFGGAIRDLWQPLCYGDPDKVSSPSYYCGSADGGGVHTNSGVPNHAFALLVDGGTYNGRTITGLGLAKTSHIYWRAASVYQTSASDFADHADALEASCADLIGASLFAPVTTDPGTWGGTIGSAITAADCTEVADAIAAVELRVDPSQCGFGTLLDPNAPQLCGGASVQAIHLQDWESGVGTWTTGTRSVVKPSTFDTPDWAVVGSLPDGRAGSAAFVKDDPALGDCVGDVEAGVLYLQSPALAIPPSLVGLYLAFDHWVSTETGWDGGNLKVSVNGGPFTLVPASAFTFNAYDDSLNSSAQGNDDPLAGEEAFTGSDGGSVRGSWGQSQVDLSAFAGGGDTVQLRFELGIDGCNGRVGWYVDDVRLYSCGGTPLCGPTPEPGCRATGPFGASLTIVDSKKDRFLWKMRRGDATTTADFLDPTQAGRSLSFCLYDDSAASQPILESDLASAGRCDGRDCWKPLNGKGYKYRSKTGASSDGVTAIGLKEGDAGKARVLVKARGSFVTLPNLPLTPPLTAQLIIDDGVTRNCWESSFPIVLKNDGAKFKAKGP